MTRLARWSVIAIITLAYGGAAMLLPVVGASSTIKSLSGINVLVTGLLGWFFRQFHNITGAGVLRARELDRYAIKRTEMRARFWRAFAFNAAVGVLLYALGILADGSGGGPWVPFVAGFLVSLAICNACMLVSWINELSAFADKLRVLEQDRKEHAEQVKRLDASSKG